LRSWRATVRSTGCAGHVSTATPASPPCSGADRRDDPVLAIAIAELDAVLETFAGVVQNPAFLGYTRRAEIAGL